MTTLRLADEHTARDLTTYLSRASRLEDDGAVRLQATGRALAVWIGVLKGRGVAGDGTVLGLRVLALAEAADVDEVVPMRAVADRLARGGDELPVPPQSVRTSWAAVSPPRAGWNPIGTIDVATLRRAAAEGITEVTEGAPDGSGAAAVESLRQRVWSRSMAAAGAADGLPAGVAFGAHSLGFLVGDHAQVLSSGRWFRVSTAAGHVLVR